MKIVTGPDIAATWENYSYNWDFSILTPACGDFSVCLSANPKKFSRGVREDLFFFACFLSCALRCSMRVLVINWTLLALNTCNTVIYLIKTDFPCHGHWQRVKIQDFGGPQIKHPHWQSQNLSYPFFSVHIYFTLSNRDKHTHVHYFIV